MLHYGFITVRWYGLFIVLGILAAISLTLFFARRFKIETEKIWDLSFYLVLFGIIGARIYEIFLEFPYYSANPSQILKIWEGGLAIHGAIIAGAITLFIFIRKYKLNFWTLLAIVTPGLALGQAIGRFGNWFNQELFGLPTNLPWGIPIDIINRPIEYINQSYFQPTFLFESLGNLCIAGLLFYLLLRYKDNLTKKAAMRVGAYYLASYSLLRFSLEFIKVDATPMFLGLRWPQVISLFLIIVAVIIYKKSSYV